MMARLRRSMGSGSAQLGREKITQGRLRPRAEMADDLGCRDARDAAALGGRAAMRVAEDEARDVEIARTRGVDDTRHRSRFDDVLLLARQDERALRAARERRDAAVATSLGDRGGEVRDLPERADLRLV